MTRGPLAFAVVMLTAAGAAAQSVTAEADVTAGVSSENVRAGSAQARVFGASASDWRFFAEASIGGTDGHASDAFSAAYPYDRRLRPMEVYVEKTFHPRGYVLGFKGGRYRTPFGIYARGDYGYSGFVRPPLIRYGREFALSNTAFEGGVNLIAGAPQLYAETSVGVPQDEGILHRRRELDASIRVQGYYKGLIAGASRIHSGRDRALGAFARGRSIFNGVDARWMSSGLQVRGEWIFGRPFDGVTTHGGYIDVTVHRRAFGPVTPVIRAERLDYDAGRFSLHDRRVTAGARIHLFQYLTAQVNVIHQPRGLAAGRATVIDAGLTVSIRR
jgi:hypothetical protein